MSEQPAPTWDEITRSAEAAASEIRSQIDHQISDASALDTKASTLITAQVAIAGLVASRVVLDTPERLAAGAIAFAVVVAVALPAVLVLRPRDGFSYGADAAALTDSVARYPRAGVAIGLAESLARARDQNLVWIRTKQRWYEIALLALFGLVLALALMVVVGAIR